MAADAPDWAREDVEQGASETVASAPPETALLEDGADGDNVDGEPAPGWMTPGQQPVDDEEYVNVDQDLEHQPDWMSGKQAAPPQPEKRSMREEKYRPAWSQSGDDPTNSRQPLVASDPPHKSQGCCTLTKKICCSFRTTLVPLLVVISFLAVFALSVRVQLQCNWNIWVMEIYSVACLLLASLFIYGIVTGKGWMCSGWFFSMVFAFGSAVVAICEWVQDIGEGGACKENSDGGAVRDWMVPLSSTVLIGCWALSCYLFSIGAKTIEKEEQLLANQH